MTIPLPPDLPKMRSSKVIAEAFDLGKKIGFNNKQVATFVNQYLLHPSDRYRTTYWVRRERWASGRETPGAEIVLAFQEFSELCKQTLAQRISSMRNIGK